MKTLGIVTYSFEGGALCFLTACREGGKVLGAHMHPPIVVSAIPLGLSISAWDRGDLSRVADVLVGGVQQVAGAGADFYVCPDNTAHIVLEQIAHKLPIPGLHIAQTVCREVNLRGWKRVGLLGTKWTVNGNVYDRILRERGIECIVSEGPERENLHAAIIDGLCQGDMSQSMTRQFLDAIAGLRASGAEGVILGCTEIPLVVRPSNSPLPVLDSTRLLARYAVAEALNEHQIAPESGWLVVKSESDHVHRSQSDTK